MNEPRRLRAVSVKLGIEPPTANHQNKKIGYMGGRAMLFDTTNLKNARALLISQLLLNKPKMLTETGPLVPPLRLSVVWRFTVPSTRRKKLEKSGKAQFKTTSPDTSNLLKTLEDCLVVAGYAANDAHFAEHYLMKAEVVNDPGIGIIIQEVDLCISDK